MAFILGQPGHPRQHCDMAYQPSKSVIHSACHKNSDIIQMLDVLIIHFAGIHLLTIHSVIAPCGLRGCRN